MRVKDKYLILCLFVIAGFIAPVILKGNEYYLHVYILCAINIIAAASLRSIASTGPLSIGQAGFMGVGAYTSAILASKFQLPVYGAIPAGALATMVLALLIGSPITRVKNVYFVMVTMFLGEIIRLLLLEWRTMTGGSSGIIGIPGIGRFSIFGVLNLDFTSRLHYAYLFLIFTLVILLILYNIERSHLGRVLASIGQNENVASSVGVNVVKYKIMIFCTGCFFTGLAGSLYSHYMTVLNPGSFNIITSLYILIYVIVGGRGKFSGPIFGAIILTLIPEVFSSLKEYQPFIFVLVLFLIIFLLPGGIIELPVKIRELLKRSVPVPQNKDQYND